MNRAVLMLALLAFGGATAAAEAPAPRETIAVIGTGMVGGTLGAEWGQRGHTIIYGSRDPARPEVEGLVSRSGAKASATTPAQAVRQAQIVVLAVPWEAAQASASSLGDVTGKLVIDVTNPLTFEGEQVVEAPVPRSGAELVQAWLRGATIVKAFNTLNFRIMADPASAGGAVTVPMASDDAAAKKRVAQLIGELGLEPFNAGKLANSKYLEGMAILYLDARGRKPAQQFEYYFRRR